MVLIWILVGCTAPRPQPPDPVEPAAVERVTLPPAQRAAWLQAAEDAMARDHLTFPEAGSAASLYRKILELEPGDQDAVRGLERIVETYVYLSEQALSRRQFATARSMLARARLILPDHPSIEPSAARIRLIQEADRKTLPLQQSELTAEAAAVAASLRRFAEAGKARDCRYTIKAKNDGQGRWIYKRLSQGHGERRLRAQIHIQLPASVERLCFAS